MSPYIEPATHEVSGNLIFTEAGLTPYHALQSVTKGTNYGKPVTGTFRRDGEQYTASLKPKGSGLKPWDDPSFQYQKVKEFVLQVEPTEGDDLPAAPSVTFTVKPRWPDMESLGDSPNPSNPGDLLGVNVRFDGSNIPLEDYLGLLRRGMSAVDINPEYFSALHEQSNVWRFEHYVRVNRERSQAVIGDGGPIRRIFEYIESEGKLRELREDDTETIGYHHRVKFDSDAARSLIDGHTLGKQIKHYHPKHVHGDPDDPLDHPKIGVAFFSRLTSDGSVAWSERDRLEREVDETLINVLSWSDLSVRSDTKTYVKDIHFTRSETERALTLIDDPLPQIKREQGAAVISALNGAGTGNPNLNESDTETLRVMADGGTQDVGALAEAINSSTRTVYRVIERLSDILIVDNGQVGFASEYLQSKVRYGLQCATDALESATKDREGESAWSAFVSAYGPQVCKRFPDTEIDRIRLDFGEIPPDADIDEILKEGLRAWVRSGRDPMDYRGGAVRYEQNGSVESTPSTSMIGASIGPVARLSELKSVRNRDRNELEDVYTPE